MMKQEFEKLIGKEVSEEDYSLIDRVYTFHPAISETEGKKQIAILYNAATQFYADASAACRKWLGRYA